MMPIRNCLGAATAISLLHLGACANAQETAPAAPARVIVLTDIEADPDDTQSLVRLLLYANEIDIRGLVATTSTFQKERTAPESIRAVVDAYGEVKENLDQHADGYPGADALLAIIKSGLPVYGMNGVGAGMDSEGSDWIIRELEAEDERPLWVSVWGGPNTLAQALFRIREAHTEDETNALVSRLRIYAISDQDDSGAWIRKEFPDLFYIVSPGGQGNATWDAIAKAQPGYDAEISNDWLARNIQRDHGPLGAAYPDVQYGMEGDTPSFLGLVSNGLNAPEHPDWGGWGGRYELYVPDLAGTDPTGYNGGVPILQETRPIWTNAVDAYSPWQQNGEGETVRRDDVTFRDNRVTVWRWLADAQNDFAARMDWTQQSFADANHPPDAHLVHPARFTVRSGQTFTLDGRESTDPDGDGLTYLWFNYPEAGSLDDEISVSPTAPGEAIVTAPDVQRTETAHFILRVTDDGGPPLSRYQRVIVSIEPAGAN